MSAADSEAKRIFSEARALSDPSKRAAYVQEACSGNPVLREEVESLLRAYARAGDFLGRTVRLPAPDILLERAGMMIGRYKLLERIGEGGFGDVFMAEQVEPVQRKVALKIVKAGMDTREVISRFEAERQALALMDHPNIARVFDAGATDAGRPYFVMELVHGIPITAYCDQNNFSTEHRLQVFIKVCHAVQHAHQKGIIHRDLKPSNVLVTLQDGETVPKVIDFGVAKALGPKLTDKTVHTGIGQFIGTPAYMSPEQAAHGGLDVDTRSDIYALGAVLYELLTGRTPFEAKDLAQAGVEEIAHRIREEEPPKPSTRLSLLAAEEQAITARRRATEPLRLLRLLRGDLDWIIMKCLEKDRSRRYQTANELARDVEFHLRGHPVSAAAPTLGYRTMKYIRRHRRALATTAALVFITVLGTTLSVWQARRARQAERERTSLRNAKWALETALPAIERSLEKDDYPAAFRLVEQAQRYIGENPRFQAVAARVVRSISVETTPPGAQVFIRDYSDLSPGWEPIGYSPLTRVILPWGFKRWKISLAGYQLAEGTLLTRPRHSDLKIKLDKTGTVPAEMVRVHGENFRANLRWLDFEALPALNLPDFLFDRYEVSNRQYKEFVQAGGYYKPKYWKHKFIKDDVELSWAAAIKLLVDQTGQPGPATWKDGDYPKGQDEHPVGGISWYEAAAYAEFAGKRLPTVYHWSLASGDSEMVEVGYLIPLSNFGENGPAPVGTFQGMTSHGIYDMAGNVKEWCFNEAPEGHRVNAGGAWNEPEYMFHYADKYPPFFRGPNFGFRCMKPLADDPVWEKAARPVQYSLPPVLSGQKPCSDEAFQAYKRLYEYNESELQPTIEATEDLSIYTRRQRVSFNAAYGSERMIAYVHLPRAGSPPYQTVIYFPGDGAWSLHSISNYGSSDLYDHHARNGRAFVFPVMHGTFERMVPPEEQARTSALESWIMCIKDFRRTIDYLETRPEEFDLDKLAYEGLSRGGVWGGIVPAIETRIKVVVMFGGGLHFDFPPEYSQVNFAPRIKAPILLQNGRYDFVFPLESNQRPFFALFGTPEKDKHFRIYEAGHSSWLKNEVRKDELEFLNRYLGPVN